MTNKTEEFNLFLEQAIDIAYTNKNFLIYPEHFILALLNNQNSILFKSFDKNKIESFIFLLKEKLKEKYKHTNFYEKRFIKLDADFYSMSENIYSIEDWIKSNINYFYKNYFIQLKINQEDFLKELQKNKLTISEYLLKYTINLNLNAIQEKVISIGRTIEKHRIMKTLLKQNKNNILITGYPGIGKTNLIEAVVNDIVYSDVPVQLKNKTFLKLNLLYFLSGIKYQGELEERFSLLIKEIKNEGNIILFIDNLEQIDNKDFLNNLKQTISNNLIQIIAISNENIKDDSFVSLFQEIKLEEPSVSETITIMRGIKSSLEKYHNITIEDKALISSVELSKRYINNKYLPLKAIEIIDESSSELKMAIETEPFEIIELNDKKNTLETEKEYNFLLKKDNTKLIEELNKIEIELNTLTTEYKKEKDLFLQISENKEKIKKHELKIDLLQKENNFESAAEEELLLSGYLTKEKELNLEWEKEESFLLKCSVDDELVSKVISDISGIPLSKMKESELEKVLKMKELLSGKVIGQDQAVNSISKIIQKNKAGLSDADKPIGSFLFLGTSGVGKTHMAKELAKFLFNDSSKMIRFDMSEYMDKSSISRLTGAAPGLIGYDAGGQLTEAVKKDPYSVILFDEVEKAHPDIFNLLLQVLDDGRLTDSKGNTVDFKNTIIVLTSNIGSKRIVEISEKEAQKKAVLEELKSFFRPEFINRLDDLIVFNPLSLDDLIKISFLLLKDVQNKLERRNIILKVSFDAISYVAKKGYDPLYGARPLRRAIDEYIEEVLTMELLKGSLIDGSTISFEIKDEELIYSIL